jgi:elongation factor G
MRAWRACSPSSARTRSGCPEGRKGDTLGFVRLEGIAPGDCFATGKARPDTIVSIAPPEPVYAVSLKVKDRKDDVRLSAALAKIARRIRRSSSRPPETGEMRLLGQGEMHLRVAMERLASRFQVAGRDRESQRVNTARPSRAGRRAGRHKKQTGGTASSATSSIEVKPLARGRGLRASRTRSPAAWCRASTFPPVETGVRTPSSGAARLPVVDLAVELTDGSTTRSIPPDAAFQAAAKLALAEALPEGQARAAGAGPLGRDHHPHRGARRRPTGLVTGRRGQILGYDRRPGWQGWDVLKAMIPESEIGDLIVELRSATAGVGTFSTRFDHMAELTGRSAEQVVQGLSARAGH